jgi:hypothetical protein
MLERHGDAEIPSRFGSGPENKGVIAQRSLLPVDYSDGFFGDRL